MGKHPEKQDSTEPTLHAAELQRVAGLRCLAQMIAKAYLRDTQSFEEAGRSEKKAQ